MKRQEHYVSDSYNDYLNKAIQNIYIPVNYTPILPESRNGVIGTLENSFKKVEELNEQIKQADLADNDELKSSLRQQKNAICKQMIEYSGESHNKSQNQADRDDYMAFKMKFWNEQEQDMDLMEKHYGKFKPENHSNNKMLLETKSYYEDLEEKINKTLADKNVNQESIDKTWQSASTNFEKHLEKCISYETFVKQMQAKVLEHGCLWGGTNQPKSFIHAKNMAEQLNVKHKQAIDNLKFNSEQVIKQFVAKGLVLSGQSPEDSSIILEIKGTYESLEETINKSLADKNIDEEVKNQVWQLPFYSSKYKQVLDKLKTHEKLVRMYEDQILNCDTSLKANSLNMELKKIHKDAKDELNFHTNQAIKHFINKAFQLADQPLEESPMMLDIKNIHGGFKEKINKNFEDNLINEKIKSDVGKLFRPKCDQHLDKLKFIEKSVQKCEHELLMSDNFKQAKYINDSLHQKQREIDNWKLASNNLTEEIINKAIEFSYQIEQVQPVLNEPQLIQPVVNIVPNQQSNLIIEESEMDSVIEDSLSIITTNSMILNQSSLIINPIIANEGSVAILKIKSLLDGFEKKLNDSLNDNSDIINEKIKSAIYKIYHPKCKKHLENLELIEKSIKKYEDLPNSQKTEKIINHLKQRYKQIDKWELDSDDLIETITMKALELSCKTEPMLNEQNNLQVQKLMDEMTELKNMVKINQNLMEIPPINELDHDESDSFQILNLNQSINPLSLFEHVEAVSENHDKKEKEKELKKIKWKSDVKGEIKLIKIGIKNHIEDEIKEDLEYTKNHLTEIINHFMSHEEDFITKGNESPLVKTLGDEGWISDFE